jgi:hypothetical protein
MNAEKRRRVSGAGFYQSPRVVVSAFICVHLRLNVLFL